MIEFPQGKLSHILSGMTKPRKLRPLESLVLEAWRNTLPDACREVLDSQLQAVSLIQRQAGDAKVCFYYSAESGIPLFTNQAEWARIATVVVADRSGNATHRMSVDLFIVKGRFFSIEFPKRPERYLKLHRIQESDLQVIDVASSPSPASRQLREKDDD